VLPYKGCSGEPEALFIAWQAFWCVSREEERAPQAIPQKDPSNSQVVKAGKINLREKLGF
jgi:hypothetical protein